MENSPSSLPLDGFVAVLPGWIFVANGDGQLVALSPALRRLLGPTVASERLQSHLHADDRAAFAQSWESALRDGNEVTLDCRMVDDSGQYTYLRCRLRRGSGPTEGKIFGVLERGPLSGVAATSSAGSHTDSSGHSDSFSYESYLRVVTDYLPLVLWVIDRDGVFTLHKGKAMDVTGITANQFLGRNIFELYGDGSVEEVRRALSGEVSHSFNDLHGLSWENWLMPLQDKSGVVRGAVGCSLNITESKRNERELQARIGVIQEQQQIISSLSTPIIQVWDQVLTLPIFGNVDTERASTLMNNLLREVTHTRAKFAILDLTGVELIDTSTAAHLVSLIRALRLLGTEGIITGIKARIAQTVVGLGVDLTGITTLSTLQTALRYCMQRL